MARSITSVMADVAERAQRKTTNGRGQRAAAVAERSRVASASVGGVTSASASDALQGHSAQPIARRQPEPLGFGTEEPDRCAVAAGQPETDREECLAHARGIVLRSLARAPRTRNELADKLQRKGLPGDIADEVLRHYQELGLIDDRKLAAAYAQNRLDEGWAVRAIGRKLRERGVSKPDADAAVAMIDGDMERAAADRLVARKWPNYRHLAVDVRERRLAAVLERRGHNGYVARKSVAAVATQLAAEDR